MPRPPPISLAVELAPLLSGLAWGIGGSALLWKLGLEAAPRDLDVVTTAEDFDDVCARIAPLLGPGRSALHGTYASGRFLRFDRDPSRALDLFADVRVNTPAGTASWDFDPGSVQGQSGLPWMRVRDWIELYDLFQRPERAHALRAYLESHPTSG